MWKQGRCKSVLQWLAEQSVKALLRELARTLIRHLIG